MTRRRRKEEIVTFKVDDSLLRDELRREFERQGCTVPEWAVEIQARLAGIESRLALRDNNPFHRWIDNYTQEQFPNTATIGSTYLKQGT